MKTGLFYCFCCFFTLISCSDYSPKPQGYFRIDLEPQSFHLYENEAGFSFQIPSDVKVELLNDSIKSGWFNLFYPSLNVRIYCSYFPINRSTFGQANEYNLKMIKREILRDEGVSTREFSNPEEQVFAIIYDIPGNVASPVQVMITDSVSHFFRASLYFDSISSQDSIAPVKEYIRENMVKMVESFQWKSK